MMQAAEDRLGSNMIAGLSLRACRRWTGSALVRAPMRLPSIVIDNLLVDGLLQMLVAKNWPVVQAVIADTPDYPAL